MMEDTSRLMASDTLLEWLEYSWYVGGSFGLTASCLAAVTMLHAPSIIALPADTMGSWAFLAYMYKQIISHLCVLSQKIRNNCVKTFLNYKTPP